MEELTKKLSSVKIEDPKPPELSSEEMLSLHLKPDTNGLKFFWGLYEKINSAKATDLTQIEQSIECIQLLFLNRFVRVGFVHPAFAKLWIERFKKNALNDPSICQKNVRTMVNSFKDIARDEKKNPGIIDFVTIGYGNVFQLNKKSNNYYDKIISFHMQLLMESSKSGVCSCDFFICGKPHQDFVPKVTDYKAAFIGSLEMILHCYLRKHITEQKQYEKLRDWRKEVLVRINHSLNIQSTLRLKNEMRFRTIQELCCLISLESFSSPTTTAVAYEGLLNYRPSQRHDPFDLEKFNLDKIDEKILLQEALETCENSTKAKLFDVSDWNFDSSGKPLGEKKAEALLLIWKGETKQPASVLSVYIFLYLAKKLGCKGIRAKFNEMEVFGFKQTTSVQIGKQEEMIDGWIENITAKLKTAHPNVCLVLSGYVDWLGVASSAIKKVTRAFQSLIDIELDDISLEFKKGKNEPIEIFVDWRKDCCKGFLDQVR
jgi:hypothetical protein